jgi:hypothetical protein
MSFLKVNFDELTGVLDVFHSDRKASRVEPAPNDGHILLERDGNEVVGLQFLGARTIDPTKWKEHPDRELLPVELRNAFEGWLDQNNRRATFEFTLHCGCGATTERFKTVLGMRKPGASAPVTCPSCQASFAITFVRKP